MFKKAPVLLLLLCLIVTMGMVGSSAQGAPDGRLRVAILSFDDGSIQGRDRWWEHRWEVGRGVADELVTALFNTGKFRLIERDQIQKVLNEQHLAGSGRIDLRTAARVGKILGVQVLIMGKVTQFATDSTGASINTPRGIGFGIKSNTARVTLDARMVDTSSAEIIAIATGKGEKKQTSLGFRVDFTRINFGSNEFRKTNLGVALRDAVNQLAEQLVTNAPSVARPPFTHHHEPPVNWQSSPLVPIIGRVTAVYKDNVDINIGYREFVRPGMKFKVYQIIDTINDPKDGKVFITESVAKITVISVEMQTATCKIDNRLDSKTSTAVNDIVRETE
jgi:curli biogenesis system outer membrane secretion channel CsgG